MKTRAISDSDVLQEKLNAGISGTINFLPKNWDGSRFLNVGRDGAECRSGSGVPSMAFHQKKIAGAALVVFAASPLLVAGADANLESAAAIAIQGLPEEIRLSEKRTILFTSENPPKSPVQPDAPAYPIWVQWFTAFAVEPLTRLARTRDGLTLDGGR